MKKTIAIAVVFAGTLVLAAPPTHASGWFYAYYNGRCYKTLGDAAFRAANPVPRPEIWQPTALKNCGDVPKVVDRLPYTTRGMNTGNDGNHQDSGERGRSESQFFNLPRMGR